MTMLDYQLQQEDERFDYQPNDYFIEDCEVVVVLQNDKEIELILEGEQVVFNGYYSFYDRFASLLYILQEINSMTNEDIEEDEIVSIICNNCYELI